MKRLILAVIACGVVAGLGFYVSRPKSLPDSPAEPVAENAPASADAEPQTVEPIAARPEPPPAAVAATPTAAKPVAHLAATPGPPVLDATFLSRTVDLLVSPQASFQQKQDAWKQLRDTGKLDQAIT